MTFQYGKSFLSDKESEGRVVAQTSGEHAWRVSWRMLLSALYDDEKPAEELPS